MESETFKKIQLLKKELDIQKTSIEEKLYDKLCKYFEQKAKTAPDEDLKVVLLSIIESSVKDIKFIKGQDGKDGADGVSVKGEDGYTPIKGVDYFTEDEINSIKKLVTPIKGVDYFTPEELERVKTAVRPIKGVDYMDGKDGVTTQIIQNIDITGEKIVDKINGLDEKDENNKIDAKHIKNLPDAVQQVIYTGGGGGNSANNDVFSGWFLPKVSGDLYTAPFVVGTPAGSAIGTGTVFLLRFYENETTTYSSMRINIVTAGANVRLGVWDSQGNLIEGSNSLATSNNTDCVFTFANPITIQKGFAVWLGITSAGAVTPRFISSTSSIVSRLPVISATIGSANRAQYSFTFGALANLPALTYSQNGPPAIYLTKA